MKEQKIIIIAAVAENNVIGNRGQMPWHIKEDMQHFKALTTGNPCIMGRITYESFSKKPLPDRENIVISANPDYHPPGAIVMHSLAEALQYCSNKEKVFICGGSALYKQAVKIANTIELTRVHATYNGDTFFPEIDFSGWIKIRDHNMGAFSFQTYERSVTSPLDIPPSSLLNN